MIVVVAVVFVQLVLAGAERGFFFRVRLLLGQQRFAIGVRDLIVIGVDLAEGQEAVAIAAEVDERCLQRGFYTRDRG